MALKTCDNCGRKFSAARTRCPSCRRRHYGDREAGRSVFTRLGLAAIVVLLAVSVGYNLNRETGPSAEVAEMHNVADAVTACRQGIETELADWEVDASGPLRGEYLGGREYEVDGVVTVVDGGVRTQVRVLCEALYDADRGWRVLDVALRS